MMVNNFDGGLQKYLRKVRSNTMPCCEDCPCVNYCDGSMIEACMDDWRKRKQKESEVEHDA
jgi:hypothetical protein